MQSDLGLSVWGPQSGQVSFDLIEANKNHAEDQSPRRGRGNSRREVSDLKKRRELSGLHLPEEEKGVLLITPLCRGPS